MRSKNGRRLAYVAVGVATVLCLSEFSVAFFPTNLRTIFGALGSSHEQITKDAVTSIDMSAFGVTKLTRSMKSALTEFTEANAGVDEDQFSSAKHFDGENFAGGQAVITQNFQTIVDSLAANNATGARAALGRALHTIQDFYSHTNWIESGHFGPSADLGRPGHTLVGAGIAVPTCVDCVGSIPPFCPDCSSNLVTPLLTSGYYGGEDRTKPSPAKCSHGGTLDGSATGEFGFGINKDCTDCLFSPHHNLHASAASVARAATEQFINDIKAQVTDKQFRLLMGAGPTLAICIDTTGSMGSIIAGVKASAVAIVNARLGTPEEPSKYILAPFNDPSVGPLTSTTDATEFIARINSLGADGGDDCPELAMHGMLQALGATDQGGDLFVFTDATAKDSGLSGLVSSLAVDKEIQVYPILFGSCSPIDPGFIKVANDSGGQLFFLPPSQASAITMLADRVVRSNNVQILSVAGTFAATPVSLTLPVDSTVGTVTFSVSGTTAATIRRPNGTPLLQGEPGVTRIALASGVIFSVSTPPVGQWTAELAGTGDYSVNVSGVSSLDLTSFKYVRAGGRPGHEGYFKITGHPSAGSVKVTAEITGDFAAAGFELRSKAGATLQTITMAHGPGQSASEFTGELVLPGVPFIVYATGVDNAGAAFQRLLPSTTRAQTVAIAPPPAKLLPPGVTTTYDFRVTNNGPANNFQVLATDDRGYLGAVAPATFPLMPGETKLVTVQLVVPQSALPGTPDTLTVTAQSTLDPSINNFAVVESAVGSVNSPPNCAGAQADVALLWPPNGSSVPVHVLGVVDPEGGAVTIEITGIMQDEPVNGLGDGDTSPDGAGIGTNTAWIRAERSGTGDGRVYVISFRATDVQGAASDGSVTVSVPHAPRRPSVNNGAVYDSTQR